MYLIKNLANDFCCCLFKEGRQYGESLPVQDLLDKLQKTRYTWEELQERPLPEGVDPLKLEAFLEDEEFEEVLGMKRDTFYAMPSWKQSNIKKENGLY